MTHEIALDKATMTYSWHNISDQYKNNQIKYSPDGGTSWETVKFVDGMYTYSDLNDYLHQYMKEKGHKIFFSFLFFNFYCFYKHNVDLLT